MIALGRLIAFPMLAATLAGCSTTTYRDRAILGAPEPDGPVSLKPAQAASIQVALGRSLEKDGDLDRARLCYLEALRVDSKNAQARLRLAILLDRAGKFPEAAEQYEKALQADPGNPDIFCDRGYSLALQGRPTEAEAALGRAIAIAPGHPRAHNNLGLVLARAGKSEEARREFLLAGLTEPDARTNLAFGLAQARRFDEAKANLALAGPAGARSPSGVQLAAMVDGAGRSAAVPKDGALVRTSTTAPAAAAVPTRR